MAVKDELDAINAGPGTDFEKRLAREELLAQRFAQALPSMARPYTRNSYVPSRDAILSVRYIIHDYHQKVINGRHWFGLEAEMREGNNAGPVLREREWHYFREPRIEIPDGTEPDPDNPGQMRTKWREDLLECVRFFVERKLR